MKLWPNAVTPTLSEKQTEPLRTETVRLSFLRVCALVCTSSLHILQALGPSFSPITSRAKLS